MDRSVTAEAFERYARGLLLEIGAAAVVAEDVAWATVESSLCGVDTHGVTMLLRILKRAEAGRSQLLLPATLVGDSDNAVAVLDARLTPGQHSTMAAAREAAARAKRFGVGYVAARNSTHFGSSVPFLRHLASERLAGMVGSNSLRSMAAFGLKRANLGNNPFGFVVPADPGPDFVFDASAAVMSFGRRAQRLGNGESLPEDAWLTPEGPVDDLGVCEVADSLEQLAVPFGGFKGASVAVFVELLAGLLPRGQVGAATETISGDEFFGPGHFVLAFDPRVMGTRTFAADVRAYLDGIHRGSNDVRIPGERLARVRAARAVEGIPMDEAFLSELDERAKAAGYQGERPW
jgi:LDH2 family malate/lactate/ureidoglycolate dehydrogenase